MGPNDADTFDRLTPEIIGTPYGRGEQLELAQLKTSFARFPIDTCRRLVRLGWWMTGAAISKYHPDLLRGRLPEWED